jgi:hypothetical protein
MPALWLWNSAFHSHSILPPYMYIKLKVYIFSKWRIVFIMNSKVFMNFVKIFMNFVKILKLLWVFEVIVKKIHINYKIYSQTSNFFIVCVNHNTQHNDGWKLSVILKLVISTTLCSKCQTFNCNKSFNFQIFSKFQNGLESKFCKLYFVN